MIRHIADSRGKVIGSEEATPICGVDFCDSCGDCLVCYIEDPCPDGLGHFWVRYEE